jgi:hypothetical protein
MKSFNTALTIASLLAFTTVSTHAFSAVDGTLGATSTATSLISVTVPSLYKITGIADIALGSYSGTGGLTGAEDVCVYSNATGAYHVVATDSSTMSATGFSAQNAGATAQIPYTVKWNSATGTTGNAAVTYNTALAATNASTTSQTCGGGNNANLQISMIATDLQAAAAGSYSTTISVLIEP